jgi:hypothetical protein
MKRYYYCKHAESCHSIGLVQVGSSLILAFICLVVFSMGSSQVSAQIPTVVFEDDFSSNDIDSGKYTPDSPFFEGGIGDIHAEAGDGVMRFVGTTTTQWWSGATLRINETFNATEDTPVTISIDRVAEAGEGSASRSALWIHDETQSSYVLFAYNRGENGWQFNRKIGEAGDNPTGGGSNIGMWEGDPWDDNGLHRMQIVANGQTVQLILDGELGPEVTFPFSKVTFQFGSYARANNDTGDTTWDNLSIETNLPTTVVFEDDFSSDSIDPSLEAATPFFEGGVGDIHAEAGGDVMRFVGSTTTQWWSGGTLKFNQTLNASEETPVSVSIDRVAEAGEGSASRSALWIHDETQNSFVLFADVRGEGGWRFNRNIGEEGDVKTGSGTDIGLFNGGDFDDGGFHKMQMIANGQTVKLILDGQLGTEVKFPFSKVTFQFGSYARANNDTADTTWDNLKIEAVVRQTNVVFSDDFSSETIDASKFEDDSPFFEGGIGNIHAEPSDGGMRFVGETTTQWWSGGTLRVVPTFSPSDSETITLNIDRVSEAGQGTSTRSALWILDAATQSNYVLFADNQGENGWQYNRKIGEEGDTPTGGGTNLPMFEGDPWDGGGNHNMSMIADGSTVKLFLDGVQGAEVRFPFSPVVFHFGSYARANGDSADTLWDNLVIESAGGATFEPSDVSVRLDGTSQPITVRIPKGLNSSVPVEVSVRSDNPSVAVPEGGDGGTLALTFPAGGANTATFRVSGIGIGGAQFTIEGGIAGGNRLNVAVLSDPGIVLDEDFSGGSIDSSVWEISNVPFEDGEGNFTVNQTGGTLVIDGVPTVDSWAGASLRSANSYIATKDLTLAVEVDRVSVDQNIGVRTGIFLSTADRSQFVFFSQNSGGSLADNTWQVNTNPGSPTGDGSRIAAFSEILDIGNHRIRMVADGSSVEIFLDGVSGGSFPFEVTTGIYVEIGAYAELATLGDIVRGVFDNVVIENVLPCVSASPDNMTITLDQWTEQVAVSVPQLLNDTTEVTVTITSRDPAVAMPLAFPNAAGGEASLTLTFAVGSASTQFFTVDPIGRGMTAFDITVDPEVCVAGPLVVDVVAVPLPLVEDDFSGSSFDTGIWRFDDLPFDTGFATPESGITQENGLLKIDVTGGEGATWAGMGLFTNEDYTAEVTAPISFVADRESLDFVLVAGTSADQIVGAWVRDVFGNYVFFHEHAVHDARSRGWRYNVQTGDLIVDHITIPGLNIDAFDGPAFDDQGAHEMRMVANGETVKLYLDGVFGVEVPFPFSTGLTFGLAAYIDQVDDVVVGYFENASVLGGIGPVAERPPREDAPPVVDEPSVSATLTAAFEGDSVVISWNEAGTLQSASAIGSATNWQDVSPQPDGNSFTISIGDAASNFYRVVGD